MPPTLTIHNDKAAEFEFDILIEGSAPDKVNVRFVIEETAGYNISIDCRRKTDGRWLVAIPPLTLREDTHAFRLEVIAGEYFFVPTTGSVKVLSKPRVGGTSFTEATLSKPLVVTAAFGETLRAAMDRPADFRLLSEHDRKTYLKRCRAVGTILEKSAAMLKAATLTPSATTGDAVRSIVEAARKAIGSI